MKKSRTFVIAAVFSAGFALPALADDYVRLGSVDVGFHTDRDTTWTRFGGGMEGLRLEADRSDVHCRSIVAHFADGSRQDVFSGQLRDNYPVEVDLRGGVRHVNDITFTCRSEEMGGAKIYIAAYVGRFRDEWRRSPDWSSYWSHMFSWGDARGGNDDANYWVSLGQTRFEGRDDREMNFGGWTTRSVDRIGLTALNDDARCSRIRVTFGNGSTALLDVGHLEQGRMKSIDLPGGNRDIRNLNMVCRPLNANAVRIAISVRK